ncbi:SMI1/KNR4 family protein [Listeria sp. FSL L7-0233]|uniref:SMI1/KNR4 family protein n=1 Tax=Listeria cossartiae TaxID=2838249 RepID=UPI001626E5F3|nr:SMI1/KNR4 family protein [Listeria cossartiae]MBC2182523.1 SMI1/KNR4 family protein [Listeria cossartiae subsp. cossartiae]
MELINHFLEWAKNNNWQVDLSALEKKLPEQILRRYVNIPDEYKAFYAQINLCSNAADTSWFLSEEDFLENEDDAFSWNSFEQMSLEAAAGDENIENEVKLFWNSHLPIMMGVGGGYEYYAISLIDGNVVHGSEPEFEESSVVADSFADFLLKIVAGEIAIS